MDKGGGSRRGDVLALLDKDGNHAVGHLHKCTFIKIKAYSIKTVFGG